MVNKGGKNKKEEKAKKEVKKTAKPAVKKGKKPEFKFIPDDIKKIIIKPSGDWKHATTYVRELQALRVANAFFGRFLGETKVNTEGFKKLVEERDILVSPGSAYPEKQRVVKREDLKP